MSNLEQLIAGVVDELDAAGVPDEALATLREPHRVGPIPRPAKFIATGRAWRLGELLVTRDGQLLATGHVTRAVMPTDFAANKSPAEAQRRDLQRAAVRSRFSEGESINYGYRQAQGHTVVERDGELVVRLAHATVPLASYLADRVRFAITPGWD